MIEDAYPLAALQSGMLYHGLKEARTAMFHDVFSLTLAGPFDYATLQAAVDAVLARHPVLRTSFDLTGFSEPVQLVHDRVELRIEVTDLAAVSAAEAGEALRQWRTDEQFRGYDLTAAPLLRVAVHLLPEGRFTLNISFHHAILDGWSAASLVTEVLRRYNDSLRGRTSPAVPLEDSYADFVAAERAAVESAETAEFWRDVVTGSPATRVPRWPGHPSDGPTVCEHASADLDPELTERLVKVAERLRVPLRAVLLAAHVRVLGLLSGETEVLTGIVAHGRPETATGDQVLGLFLNMVPVRVRLDRPSWAELIRDVHAAQVALLPHRRFPLFEIQRLAGRSPLFETGFDYRDFHVYDTLDDDAPVTLVERDHRETTDIPFAAAFARSRDHGGLVMMLSHDRTQFPAAQIAEVLDRYLAALGEIAADPARDPRPAEPFLAGDPARIEEWNDTAVTFTRPAAMHALVAGAAAATPDAVAVVDEHGATTYAELWRRAGALAARLEAAGAGRESVVAVGLPRTASAVIAMLAVLQAGSAVLPLDLGHPDARLAELMAAAGADLLVTRARLRDRFASAQQVVLVDAVEEVATGLSPAPAPRSPASLAFVLFTSGSTGRPKGVMLSDEAAAHHPLVAAASLGLGPDTRMAQRSPLSVDASLAELITAFAAGGAAVMVPTETVVDPAAFEQACRDFGITTAILVPSLLAPLVEAGTLARCPSLRQIASVGEALPRALAEAFLAQSDARLHNLYGPTEAGIGVTEFAARAGQPGDVVPIGPPSANVRARVLDARGEPVPVGTPGELHVSGRQLARGYLGRPGLTAERFVPDPFATEPGQRMYRTGDLVRWLPDGVLEFLGRADGQLKIRGVRTEPGEIEAVLLEHPDVVQAVVVPHQEGDRDPVLVAYLRWTGELSRPAAVLRAFLSDRLPRALVPTAYVVLDELPFLPSGKVDRAALPAPSLTPGGDRLPPRDLIEGRLVALWEETLDLPEVGVRDDFFALGGHSLSALRLTMRIRQEFGRDIAMDALLSGPTVEQLAAVLRAPELLAPSVPVVPLRATGKKPPLFFVHGLGGQVFRYHKIAKHLGEDQPVYGIPARGFGAQEEPHPSVDAMADDYARRILEARPEGPYFVGGFCVGGNLSLEVARRLRRAGAEVPLVVAFWSHADNPISPDLYDDTTLMMYALADGPFEIDRESLAGLSADEQLLAVVEGAGRRGDLNPAVTDLDQARRIMRVYRSNAMALGGYRHEPYDGDMVLLKPVEDDDFPIEDDFSWGEVVRGELRLVPIPGSRGNVADEPQAGGAAAILKGLIDGVQ
ncbi:amino acid adenylation domain-containing protein [Amycolatopsis sp. OK19-0408]|uniref:Amino acid adenylation domain-containing protein n=1 Tax=Amycolatopsis iheyensis TaxID=2945988 RepID=A0A9X2NDL9_9PSEU|nr:amino acid adenylation domain-containing protein [Amycolatopsis iheyensis]MCR6485758.1 amino acid adenylation domain-containing protein [Amycolatopsis iheyensis]